VDSPKVTLSPEQQNTCHQTLKFLHELGPVIEKVQAAGIETAAWEQLRTRLIEVNQNIARDFCGGVKPAINH